MASDASIALITGICLNAAIVATNVIKSHQIGIFKYYKIMSFLNCIIPLMPTTIYTIMLVSGKIDVMPFFIE